jgi:hypothetical protein
VEAAEGTSRPEGATDSEYWESLLLRACDLAEGRWDTVIVDEAQDFQVCRLALYPGSRPGLTSWK